ALDQTARLHHRIARQDRARIAATERNNAEGAAMVAAVLDLQEGAGVAFDAAYAMQRRGFRRHDVADLDFFESIQRSPGRGGQLLLVAEHAIDLGHCTEGPGIGLRGAAGDDDLRAWPLAAEFADRLAGLLHRLA